MQVQEEIEKLMRDYPVLRELPANLQRALLDSSSLVKVAEGEILFDVDTTIQSFILLTQGSIRVIWPGRERNMLLYRVQPGGCCAISICHLMGEDRFRVRAEVESAIQGIALPKPLFLRMKDQSPAFSNFILSAFSRRYIQLVELLGRVTSMRLDERLARLLVSSGPLVHATHEQLAQDLGSVREVISRILKEFEARGMIKLERGQIQILDLESLRNLSQFSDSGH